MITLTVNGESYRYEGPLTLQAFLERWSAGTRTMRINRNPDCPLCRGVR